LHHFTDLGDIFDRIKEIIGHGNASDFPPDSLYSDQACCDRTSIDANGCRRAADVATSSQAHSCSCFPHLAQNKGRSEFIREKRIGSSS
jgi:hypothetical protein